MRLGLFEFLGAHPDRTIEEIRHHLNIADHSVRALLLSCASLGLIKRDHRRSTYRNSEHVDKVLVGAPAAYRVAHLEAFNTLMYRPFYHLTESLQRGTNVGLQLFAGQGHTLYERLESDPEGKRIFYDWMAALSGGRVRIPAAVVEAFGEARHVLDIGGGNAGNAMELVQRLPEIKVTIVDLAVVCEIAARDVAAAGLSDRITMHSTNNFLEDPFPRGADAIMFAHIFNIYSDNANQALVRKSASALPKDGKLAIYNMVSDDDQTGSWHAGFMSLYFQVLATGTGLVYPSSRYETWFANAGFDALAISTAEWGDTIFIGTK